MPDGDAKIFRPGGISYLRIPAPDTAKSAAFYEAVFAWAIGEHGDSPGFEDSSGHVIGHFMPDLPVAGEAGVIPYVFVESVEATLDAVTANGGELVTSPYPEGNLTVATFTDPARNLVGLWQTTDG